MKGEEWCMCNSLVRFLQFDWDTEDDVNTKVWWKLDWLVEKATE